jgi:hypothetical protein
VGDNDRENGEWDEVACCILITLRTAWTKRTREVDGGEGVPDDISEGRVKEVVEPCLDLASAIGGGTGNAAKVISEPCRELCGMETTAPGAGTMVSEFSDDDECNTSAKRRGKTEVMAEPTCVAAARVRREIDEAHGPRT